MTLTELKYIIAVARTLHFGRAAERCSVSQPSLSIAVKKLEEELGVQIFERRTSDIAVTDVGRKIIDQAQRVLEDCQQIAEIAHQSRDPLSGPLKLGVIYTVGPYLLPELIREVSNSAPRMPIIIEENFTSELLSGLRSGEIDVAIMANTIGNTGFMTQELYQEDFVVAVPSHHPWVNRNFVGLTELPNQTMLLLGAGHCFRDQIIGVCPDLGHFQSSASAMQRTMVGSSLHTICHMVAQGLGITVLPASAVPYIAGTGSSIKVIPFKRPTPNRRVLMVWRKSFTRMPAIEVLQKSVVRLELNGCIPLESEPRVL